MTRFPADEAIEAARALQPVLNAFITLTDAQTHGRTAARVMAVKDLIATRGVRTTAGSRILRDWVPTRDAAVIRALARRGYVSIGKANTHEFAFGTTNDNPHYGATHNPWRPALTTGGSSGGSAAAVAAGIVPLALGTDTAGSVRIPAALCGCVGFKPGWGRIPTGGVIPLAPTLDTVGFLGATVAEVVEAVRGAGFAGMSTRTSRLAPGLRGITIGVAERHAFGRTDAGVVAVIEEALRLLEKKGARIRRLEVPALDDVVSIGLPLVRWEALRYHRRWFPAREREYGPDVAKSLAAATTLTRREYEAARARRRALSRQVRALLREVDLLAGPTVPIPAFENRVAWEPVLPGGELPRFALTRLTYPFSLSRVPAISVPAGLTDGLPVGLQLAALREAPLLAAAAAYEAARGKLPAPPVCVSNL